MRLRIGSVAFLLVLSSLAFVGQPALAAAAPAGSTYSEVWFPSRDGTMLHGDLLKPTAGCPAGAAP